MIIRGVNLKGVCFRESKGAPISITTNICKHKYGAEATWSHGTDLYKPNAAGHGIDAEINAFKYNLQMTIWENPWYGGLIEKECVDAYKTGRMGFGTYLLTWYWENPITHKTEPISDFTSTTWSQRSCDLGLITQDKVGTTKKKDYPFQDELFILTNGKYGYDKTNGVFGEVDTYTKVLNEHYMWFRDTFRRIPSVAGYSFGKGGVEKLIQSKYLGARNSIWRVEDYGYEFASDKYKSFNLTTRQNDMTGSREEKNALCKQYLIAAIEQSGWYRDFSHWHWCTDTELEDFFRTQREAMEGHNIVSLDFGTAIEYMWLRDNCNKVDAYTKDTRVFIEGDFINKDNVQVNTIKTTLSVKVDLTGTVLENKNIKSNYGIIKVRNNEYIVEIPLYGATVLEEDVVGNYTDLNLPIIVSTIKDKNNIVVTTDKDTNVVLFKVPKGQPLYNSSIVQRSNTLKTVHTIELADLDTTKYDFYIGAITKANQSILSEKKNF